LHPPLALCKSDRRDGIAQVPRPQHYARRRLRIAAVHRLSRAETIVPNPMMPSDSNSAFCTSSGLSVPCFCHAEPFGCAQGKLRPQPE
jgi:hypothetical protein